MRNSAWYHKLLRSKLSELPLDRDAASAWAHMEKVLDKNMPVGSAAAATSAVKSLGAKIISMTVYVLPAAAMILVAVHFLRVPEKPGKGTVNSAKHAQKYAPKDTQISSHEPVIQDAPLQQSDTLLASGSNDSSAVRWNAAAMPAVQYINPLNYLNHFNPQKMTSGKDSMITKQNAKLSKNGTPQWIQKYSNAADFAGTQKKKGNQPSAVPKKSSASTSSTSPITGITNYHRKISTTIPDQSDRERNSSDSRNKGDKVDKSRYIDKHSRTRLQLMAYPAQGSDKSAQSISALQAILDQQAKDNQHTVMIRSAISNDLMLNMKGLSGKEEQPGLNKEQAQLHRPQLEGEQPQLQEKQSQLQQEQLKLKDKQAEKIKRKKENTAVVKKAKIKKLKSGGSKAPKDKDERIPQASNYGINAGLNASGSSIYLGVFGNYALSKRWMIGGGLVLNSSRTISGEYSHESYYQPDSLPPFKIIDSRKVMVLDIPLNITYHLSDKISIKGGPVFGLAFNPHAISSTIGRLADTRDTLYHSKKIDTALRNTVINKLNIGFKAGVSFQFGLFNVEGAYQIQSPYKVKSDLGSYHKSFQSFQIGIGYRFK